MVQPRQSSFPLASVNMAAVAPVTPPAPLPVLPPPFLQTLVKNPNVSAACVAGKHQAMRETPSLPSSQQHGPRSQPL